jgi:wyosine [tRNA(Phe)-imidazoG37] synthetase (radical SAM superfamily)
VLALGKLNQDTPDLLAKTEEFEGNVKMSQIILDEIKTSTLRQFNAASNLLSGTATPLKERDLREVEISTVIRPHNSVRRLSRKRTTSFKQRKQSFDKAKRSSLAKI